MPTRNINLTEHLDRFVERHVKSRRYENASDIVREALRLLDEKEQEREAKLKTLQQATKLGLDEIDQGIVITGKKKLARYRVDFEDEVRTNGPKDNG